MQQRTITITDPNDAKEIELRLTNYNHISP